VSLTSALLHRPSPFPSSLPLPPLFARLLLPRSGKRTQTNHTVVLKLQGVEDKAATSFYAGKRVV
jgi:large subunit ribosomal protein L35Ae